jgi:hypothetical protein
MPNKATKTPKKTGRPSVYSLELADKICERLACGESMRSVCRDDAMPAMSTLFKWLREIPQFSQQYEKAKEESAEALMEDILDIADNDVKAPVIVDGEPVIIGGKVVERVDSAAVSHAKLRVDARKWAASKLKPKKYGDKLNVGGQEDNPLKIDTEWTIRVVE